MTTKTVALEDHRRSAQPGAVPRSLAEQETVIRYDRTGAEAVLWTADLNQARRWAARGYPVEPVSGGWRAAVPKRALSFRRLWVVLASGAGSEDGPGELDDQVEDDDAVLARMLAEEEAAS